jgi:hypothetical protein
LHTRFVSCVKKAVAVSKSRALISLAGAFGLILLTFNGLTPAWSAGRGVVILRGAGALKLLVGNTLRPIGDPKLIPTYRYFMTQDLEYRCRGWDPAKLAPNDINLHIEAGGCEILRLSLRNGRLCESFQYERCEDHAFGVTFKSVAPLSVAQGQVLGRITLREGDRPQAAGRGNRDPRAYDLIKGNGTIFPDFDPAPKPELDRPETLPNSADEQGKSGPIALGDREVASKLIGNTAVLLGRDGKPESRSGEYYSPDGRIVVINIPAPPGGADVLHPSAQIAGNIFVNRWKVEDGKLCRTENDEPAKFICAASACLELPDPAGGRTAASYCAGNSAIGPHAYISKGNPFGIAFGKSK